MHACLAAQVWDGQPGDVLAVESSLAMSWLGRQVEAALRAAEREQARAARGDPEPVQAAAALDQAHALDRAGVTAAAWPGPSLLPGPAQAPRVRWVRRLPAGPGGRGDDFSLAALDPGRGKGRGGREAVKRRGRPQADSFGRRCALASHACKLLNYLPLPVLPASGMGQVLHIEA